MNWLFLTPGEFLVMWSAAAATAVLLYLLYRKPRRRVVSTLRFWQDVETSAQPRRRRLLNEPWPLLAQLLFLLLAILALANPRWGGRSAERRHVALLVDTSVWAQMQPPGQASAMDSIRAEARRFLDSLPSDDRVLLLRVEADAAPVLPFTDDRAALRRALAELRPSDTVADLPRALEAAKSALQGRKGAAIAYIGPGFVDETQARRLDELRQAPANGQANGGTKLLARLVGRDRPLVNRGITRLALRRDPAQPDRWQLLASIQNYGDQPAPAHLRLLVGDRVVQEQAVALKAGEAAIARAEFLWAEGGVLQAELTPADDLAADNRAVAYLPRFRPARVAVFSSDPQLLRPVLAANPYLRTEFVGPGGTPSTRPDVAIYDAVAPRGIDAPNSIVFVRGAGHKEMRLTAWNAQHPATRWVRSRDITVRLATALQAQPADAVLAWSDRTPLMLARQEGDRKAVLLAFDPRQSNLPLQPAFPLLLAGVVEWMTGAIEEMAEPVGTGEVKWPGIAEHFYSPAGHELPFARNGNESHLLAFQSGLYRVRSAAGEQRVAANVPPLPARRWDPGPAAARRLEAGALSVSGKQLWPWLLLLALVPLWAEWRLFYPSRSSRTNAARTAVPESGAPAPGEAAS